MPGVCGAEDCKRKDDKNGYARLGVIYQVPEKGDKNTTQKEPK